MYKSRETIPLNITSVYNISTEKPAVELMMRWRVLSSFLLVLIQSHLELVGGQAQVPLVPHHLQ
jgi:hypothetical protein